MKKTILNLIFALAIMLSANAQTGINYQAVVRNASGEILENQNVNIEFSILETSTSGTVVYTETQSLSTNAFGNVVAIIGQGTATVGTFTSIDWASNDHFLNVKIGGTDMGTTQFMSVPYAQHAQTAQNANIANAGRNDFSIDSTLILSSGGQDYGIKTGADGKLYFQQNGSHSANRTALILDDDSKTVSRRESGVDKDLLPIAYATINRFGNLIVGTDNIGTITKIGTGRYEITITGESLTYNRHFYMTNSFGNGVNHIVSAYPTGGKLRIYILNNGSLYDATFSFMIYKP